jgi:hypothetical protein
MKTILLFLTLLFSYSSFAAEVDVLSAEFGVEDEAARPELCLTVVRIPKSGAVIGIVETMYDCFYTRQAKKSPHLQINLRTLTKPAPTLLSHLQSRDSSLEFLYSDGE